MLYNALHLALSLVELFILMGVSFYLISLIYSWLKGAPYVATQTKEIEEILKKAHLKAGQTFIELGCGDGRVVRTAVKKYKVKGIGIDINMFLIWYCRIISMFQNLNTITFQTKNVLEVNISKADIIYIFLFPSLIEKLQDKLLKETKKNTLIIAHGFKIAFLSKYFVELRKGASFITYYYRII